MKILYFDGVCNLCNGIVKFILRRDKDGAISFAPLQSRAGQDFLERYGPERIGAPSVFFAEDGRVSRRSTAALRVLRALGWPYAALYPLMLIPAPLRDLVYDLAARNRYRLFGRRETCMLPTPAIRDRFLP